MHTINQHTEKKSLRFSFVYFYLPNSSLLIYLSTSLFFMYDYKQNYWNNVEKEFWKSYHEWPEPKLSTGKSSTGTSNIFGDTLKNLTKRTKNYKNTYHKIIVWGIWITTEQTHQTNLKYPLFLLGSHHFWWSHLHELLLLFTVLWWLLGIAMPCSFTGSLVVIWTVVATTSTSVFPITTVRMVIARTLLSYKRFCFRKIKTLSILASN